MQTRASCWVRIATGKLSGPTASVADASARSSRARASGSMPRLRSAIASWDSVLFTTGTTFLCETRAITRASRASKSDACRNSGRSTFTATCRSSLRIVCRVDDPHAPATQRPHEAIDRPSVAPSANGSSAPSSVATRRRHALHTRRWLRICTASVSGNRCSTNSSIEFSSGHSTDPERIARGAEFFHDWSARPMNRALPYVAIFLVALATLMLEILLTRITSVIARYYLAFFVISLGMLGMTAGAVAVFLWQRVFPAERAMERMAQASLAFALTTPLAVALALSMPLVPITDVTDFLALLAYGAVLAVPFALSGAALTLALTRAGLPPGLAYGVDLCGAATACVLMIPLLEALDAPSAVLLTSGIAGLGALAFSARRARPSALAAAATVALLAATWHNATAERPLLRVTWVKGAREVPDTFTFVGWNTYSRVTVGPTTVEPPMMFAPNPAMPPALGAALPQRRILIDGGAATTMVRLDDARPPDLEHHGYLAWDVSQFAHRLRPTGPAAVIGVGGGRDVLEAKRAGHAPVVGIELNDLIVELHEHEMTDFSGIAELPDVELVSDEARAYLARDTRRYAVIVMSFTDTWASTGAGAFSLSENGLYTLEGWRTCLDRLEPDGIFTVSRWYAPESPVEATRSLALAMASLWSIGAANPMDHIALLRKQNIATFLVTRAPLSASDRTAIRSHADRLGFEVMAMPGQPPRSALLGELATQPDRAGLEAWAARQHFDLAPPTDDRPFFFNVLRPGTWLGDADLRAGLDRGTRGNLEATQTLVFAALVSLVLTLGAIVVPLLARRSELRRHPAKDLLAACSYFALIGFGFMLVEIALLSRLTVFLGHPTLSLTVVLGGVICFTGIGSLLSAYVPVLRRRVALAYPLVPAGLLLLANLALPLVLQHFAAADAPTRIAACLAVIGPVSAGMGLGFPLGLRLITARRGELRPDLGPWMWGINGTCGVVASAAAMACSMVWGTSTTFLIGAACYLLLPACTARLRPA